MLTKDLSSLLKKEFDWKFYVSHYDDLKHMTNQRDAWNHFKNHGYFEKRYYNKNVHMEHMRKKEEKLIREIKQSGFDWKFYVSHYPDLSHMKTESEAWKHYCDHGKIERRYHNQEIYLKPKLIIQEKEKEKEKEKETTELTQTGPYILVVMPTYNRSEYLIKIIYSFLKQTHQNYKLLIIDDGSNEHHKKEFNKIKIKHISNKKIIFDENETNMHIAKTLNKGIKYFNEHTIFTHFTWISDDNIYYPKFLSELVDNNDYFKYTSYEILEMNKRVSVNNHKYKDFNSILNNFQGCASFMWSRKAIEQIGLYDETVPGCEDFEYLLRTFKNSNGNGSIKSSNERTMRYIRHDQSLMEKKRDEIMNIKSKIVVDYRLMCIDTICYIKYWDSPYLKYYNNKTSNLVQMFQDLSVKKLNVKYVNQNNPIFDTNLVKDIDKNDQLKLHDYLAETKHGDLYILNELDYCHLKAFYQSNEVNKKCLLNFLKKSTYLITFTEIIQNTDFQTVGNTSYNRDYSVLFFKNAYKIFICDSQNLFYIHDHINKNNIIYNPPICYYNNDIDVNKVVEQDIDILFYGSIHDVFQHRKQLIDIVKKHSSEKGYNLKLFNMELYGEDKDTILDKTKIVIHVGSLPNLRTIPWAKITELMIKGVFFLIENKQDEFNIHELNVSSYELTYENNNLVTNICEVIDFYLNNPEKRIKSILRNKKQISKFNTPQMIDYIINYDYNFKEIKTNKKRNICNIKNIIAFNYGNSNFHSCFCEQYREFVVNEGLSFSYYKDRFKHIFGYSPFWSLSGIYNENIYKKYNGYCEDLVENPYPFQDMKKQFTEFLSNYQQNDTDLYVFNAEDILAFFYYYDASNYKLFYNFICKAKYILFQCEVMIDESLITVGFTSKEFINKYFTDFNLDERILFLKKLYLNSLNIYLCDSKNETFLRSNGVLNTTYFPPYINIPFKKIDTNKKIDCLFYGNNPFLKNTYRNIMINNLTESLDPNIKFIARENIYGEELVEELNKTKIVLHLPSHENLRTMPWAKISYLMINKIFFIIEENDELFLRNLQNTIIYYKHNDTEDLKNKISYYINNYDETKNIVNKCYDYYMKNFKKTILLKDLS